MVFHSLLLARLRQPQYPQSSSNPDQQVYEKVQSHKV